MNTTAYRIKRSQFIAAISILLLNGLDIFLTDRVLELTGVNPYEGNPLSSKLIQSNLLIPAKLLFCSVIVLATMSKRNHTIFRTRALWLVVTIYTIGVAINLANLAYGAG